MLKMTQLTNRFIKLSLWLVGGIALIVAVLAVAVWTLTFHPEAVQPAPVVCTGHPQPLTPAQTVKILSWNVQYMAGKGYWFFYEGGTDTTPTKAHIRQTLDQAARVIKAEDPDIVLLQEIDEAARRTHYTDQLKLLQKYLDERYPCRTEAFYWKSGFVPHPDIWGPVGMKLVILSKYRISKATRHQLPLIPENWVSRQFNLKRTLLAARIPYKDTEIVVMNTHLSAFAQGTDTMERQVAAVKSILTSHTQAGRPWVAGGDFNLLPPGNAYSELTEQQKSAYRPQTEIKPLIEAFHVIPDPKDLSGPNRGNWFTHFPNDPDIKAPNKTIDYIFYADSLKRKSAHVRQANTLRISDHLPVVAEFTLSRGSK